MIKQDKIGVNIDIVKLRVNHIRRTDSFVYNIKELKRNLQHIYDYYINDYAENRINISGLCKKGIDQQYEMFETEYSDESEVIIVYSDQCSPTPTQTVSSVHEKTKPGHEGDRIFTEKYIIMYDKAMDEIIGLLTRDSLYRFYTCEEYRAFVNENK